jgi:hypothetical protein
VWLIAAIVAGTVLFLIWEVSEYVLILAVAHCVYYFCRTWLLPSHVTFKNGRVRRNLRRAQWIRGWLFFFCYVFAPSIPISVVWCLINAVVAVMLIFIFKQFDDDDRRKWKRRFESLKEALVPVGMRPTWAPA